MIQIQIKKKKVKNKSKIMKSQRKVHLRIKNSSINNSNGQMIQSFKLFS